MSDEWREVVAPVETRVVSDDGAYITILEAGVVTKVHPLLFVPAIAAGCSVPGGSAGQIETHEEVIDKLMAAMREILAAGKKTQLTDTGEPRFSALKMKVGNFTKEQQAEAWQKVLDEDTAPTFALDE
jgi:hypothetical protein